ncbi:MAG TPA: glycoside hydrolase family protein [Verrucomicrobiae bacterium]|nr:glycoside hydrolase family protein [Verrucomicrobiae bacterium]
MTLSAGAAGKDGVARQPANPAAGGAPTANSPATLEKRTLAECLRPAVKDGGFRMDHYFLWCSSVIKVGDTYQLFASRWPAEYGMGGWTKYSECVRATATNLFGPYTFQEVVLQKRPGHWDNSRVHNVKIVTAGAKFVLFYINTANETGSAVADSVTGPWTRSDRPVIHASNPAPLVQADGSLYVFCRLKDGDGVNRGVAFTAPDYRGPYSPVAAGANLLPDNDELEDPTIWRANGQYNILLNDWKGKATGIVKAGAQYFSKDGIHYQLMSRVPVFTKTVRYDDGSSEAFSRRERPFVYVNERGEVTALFTACLPTNGPARIVVQPVDHYQPGNP